MSELNLLYDILIKKKQELQQILNITENQEVVLKQPRAQETIDMFDAMAKEKQEHIEIVLKADSIFQDIFERIKDGFDDLADNNKDQIKLLQDMIKEVTDLDVAIRVTEGKNRTIFNESNNANIVKTNAVNKKYLLDQYAKHKKSP